MSLRPALVLIAALLIGAASPSHRYQVDSLKSTVTAKVSFLGITSKTAHFPDLRGQIALRPDRLDTIDLDVELDARKITAGETVTVARLKGKDFFDVERYPTIRFAGEKLQMTGPLTATIAGEVTARGITRPALLAVTFRAPPARSTGRDPIELLARTTIDRRDFGMTAYSAVVGRKVTITIAARMVPD